MPTPDSTWGSLLTALGIIALPILTRVILSRITAARQQADVPETQENAQAKPRRTSLPIRITVMLYSLLALGVWYSSQPDLFTRLRLPITTTGDKIRAALITQRPLEFIPLELQQVYAYQQGTAGGLNVRKEPRTSHPLFTPELDRVLQRIETFDIRFIYGRLGHSVVASCEWCTHRDDYLLFAAAGLSLSYIALFCIVGIVTEASERRKRRSLAIVVVAIAAGVDVFWTGFVKGALKKGHAVQYYTQAQLCRLALHLILPPFLLMLPHNAPYLTQETFINTVQALAALSHVSSAQQSTIKNTRYAGLVREASLHSYADTMSRRVDAALDDAEFRTTLDQARPPAPESEHADKPAVERLKDWAGRTVGEALNELDAIISGSSGAQE